MHGWAFLRHPWQAAPNSRITFLLSVNYIIKLSTSGSSPTPLRAPLLRRLLFCDLHTMKVLRFVPPVTLPALLLAASLTAIAHLSASAQTVSIPLGGNAWSNHPGDTTRGQITDDGITGWTDPSTSFTVWFRVSRTGRLNISLLASVPSGGSTISV